MKKFIFTTSNSEKFKKQCLVFSDIIFTLICNSEKYFFLPISHKSLELKNVDLID